MLFYLRLTTDDEVEQIKKRIKKLRSTGKTEDLVVAILIDYKIGSRGFYEPVAREKAKAILKALSK